MSTGRGVLNFLAADRLDRLRRNPSDTCEVASTKERSRIANVETPNQEP